MNQTAKKLCAAFLLSGAAGVGLQGCVPAVPGLIQTQAGGTIVGQAKDAAIQQALQNLDNRTQTQIVQSFLRGYGYNGAIDGVMGQGTRDAWSRAQQSVPALQNVSLTAANGRINVNIFGALQKANLLDGALATAQNAGVSVPSVQSEAGKVFDRVRDDAGRFGQGAKEKGSQAWDWLKGKAGALQP